MRYAMASRILQSTEPVACEYASHDAAERVHGEDNAGSRTLPPYQILLYYNGDAYIAQVPELPGCHAQGQSYAHALHCAQEAIADWARDAIRSGRPLPSPAAPSAILKALARLTPEKCKHRAEQRRISPVKLRLHQKFGKLSNRELAARIGIVARDAPVMLSSAAGGGGTQLVRCAIALALDQLPSGLWPERSPYLRKADDAACRALQLARSNGIDDKTDGMTGLAS